MLNTTSNGALNLTLQFTSVKSNGSFGNNNIIDTWPSIAQTIVVGSGAGAINWCYWGSSLTVTAGTPNNVDFTSLTAPDGQMFTPTDLVALVIRNQTGSAGNLLVGDALANAWSAWLGATGVMTLLPGVTNALIAFLASAYTIDSTHKVLAFNSSAGVSTFDIAAFFH